MNNFKDKNINKSEKNLNTSLNIFFNPKKYSDYITVYVLKLSSLFSITIRISGYFIILLFFIFFIFIYNNSFFFSIIFLKYFGFFLYDLLDKGIYAKEVIKTLSYFGFTLYDSYDMTIINRRINKYHPDIRFRHYVDISMFVHFMFRLFLLVILLHGVIGAIASNNFKKIKNFDYNYAINFQGFLSYTIIFFIIIFGSYILLYFFTLQLECVYESFETESRLIIKFLLKSFDIPIKSQVFDIPEKDVMYNSQYTFLTLNMLENMYAGIPEKVYIEKLDGALYNNRVKIIDLFCSTFLTDEELIINKNTFVPNNLCKMFRIVEKMKRSCVFPYTYSECYTFNKVSLKELKNYLGIYYQLFQNEFEGLLDDREKKVEKKIVIDGVLDTLYYLYCIDYIEIAINYLYSSIYRIYFHINYNLYENILHPSFNYLKIYFNFLQEFSNSEYFDIIHKHFTFYEKIKYKESLRNPQAYMCSDIIQKYNLKDVLVDCSDCRGDILFYCRYTNNINMFFETKFYNLGELYEGYPNNFQIKKNFNLNKDRIF